MKIHVLSDLHCEFAPFEPDSAAVAACDLVVLAGDIDVGAGGIAWARGAFGDKPIVYVAGNYEFYRHQWTESLDKMREEARRFGVSRAHTRFVRLRGSRGGVPDARCVQSAWLSVTSDRAADVRKLKVQFVADRGGVNGKPGPRRSQPKP